MKFRKKQHETGILRAFVDEPTLDRDLLKNAAGLKKVIASAKKTLALAYPKSEITIDTALEEEHQSQKIICRVPMSGMVHSVEITHDMIGSADFRELQRLAPSAIGLGRAPYKMKVAGEETEYAGTAELVRAILESGKKGLGHAALQGVGRNEPGATVANNDESGNSHFAASET